MYCDVELNARSLARRFRSSVFCGREELSLVWTLTFLTFKTFYWHKNLHTPTLHAIYLERGNYLQYVQGLLVLIGIS